MAQTIRAEDLLLRNKGAIDPFNRLGCNIDPVVVVVEFCQVQGPRPLATVGLKTKEIPTSLDIDNLSVWLMSSEAASGTLLVIYNQQTGIYAMSYYTTIYDIRARAFQRPLCVAVLSSERPTSSRLSHFSNGVRRLVSPLIKCNRRYFMRQLSDIIKISDAVESDTVQTYYTLDVDMLKLPTTSRKLGNVAEQARKLRPRMQAMYEVLSESRTYMDCSGHTGEDRAAAEEMFMSFMQTSALCPVSELTPCVYDAFVANLHPFLVECSENHVREGVLYCANTPILRFPKLVSPMKPNTSKSHDQAAIGNEETMRTVAHHLDNLLFPVLAGDDMVVCGSVQRKHTVIDLVDKINSLKPKAHPNHKVVLWTENQEARPKGVVGVCYERGESAALNLRDTAILDTNASVLRTVPYRGVLLSHLKNKRRFPSDATLIAFVAATLTNLSSLVYMSRFLSPMHLEHENLSFDDERILVNLLTELDIVKYQALKSALEKRRSNAVTKAILL
uniref:UDENN FLCN/SMCR8-type domain-containing protein n=1 Tax=Haemonchus contortus TaxID=6289 RepID=A0A7I4Y9N2_HAECO